MTARSVAVAFLLAAACFLVYLTNLRAMGAWDSIPARLVPFSVLREGNTDLDEFGWLRRLGARSAYFVQETSNGRLVSTYPLTTPLVVTPIAAPFVAWQRAAGITDDDAHFRVLTKVFERVAASTIIAVSIALLFLAARHLVREKTAIFATVVYAFGTNTFTIGSQALWQHGLAETALAGLCLSLLGAERRRWCVAASLFAALAALARPTMALFALVAAVYVWREHRERFLAFVIPPALLGAAALALRPMAAATVLQSTPINLFTFPRLIAATGLLVSPSRGLLFFTPIVAFALPAMLPSGRRVHPLLPYLGAATALTYLTYSAWGGWWGGQSYGPRFLTDLFPALTLAAAPTLERLWDKRGWRPVIVVAALWGIALQGIGVYFDDNRWNTTPNLVAWNTDRLWDLADSHPLRALRSGWRGFEHAGLVAQLLTDPRSFPLRKLAPAELDGKLEISATPPLRVKADDRYMDLKVRLTNQSAVGWPAYSDYGFLECKVGYLWWKGDTLLAQSGAFSLPRHVGPGDTVELDARIELPPLAGEHELEILLMQVLDVNTGTRGASLRVPVEIVR